MSIDYQIQRWMIMFKISASHDHGQNPLFFEFYSTNFNNVSANDINHVVKKYLNESKRQVVIIDNKSPSKNVISRQELFSQ